MAVGHANSTQIFNGKKNAVFEIAFADTVLPVFRQNIRKQMIMINSRHAVYGIHIISHHIDAYFSERNEFFKIIAIQIRIIISQHLV
jgi:hypothetical protein